MKWETKLLNQVIDYFIDYRGKTPNKKDSGIPLITAKIVKNGRIIQPNEFIAEDEYIDWMTRGYPKVNDVVLTTEAPLGEVALIKDENVALAQRIITLRANPSKLNNIFLKYWLQSEYGQYELDSRASGTTVFGIKSSVLKTIPVPMPPLPEQKAIASVLSSLDDKIDLLHRQNKTLEAMAETLFQQWFIEEAKEDWEQLSFMKWIKETKGGDWGKENPIDDFNQTAQCIRGTDIADMQKGLPRSTPIRYIKKKKLSIITPKEGDIILEISGGTETQSTGRCYFINNSVLALFSYPLVFSNFCRLLSVKQKEYSYFIYLYLRYLYNSDEFFALENGSSGIKNLNYKALLTELKYKMPPESLVLNFHDYISVYFDKLLKNKLQIQTLEKLRDTLLPKLMSGEVRVQY